MRNSLRLLVLGSTLLILGAALAQVPFQVRVNGHIAECVPGQMVTVQTLPGTLPAQSVAVPTDGNCDFQANLGLLSATGGVFAYSLCSNGTSTGDSSAYAFSTPIDSTTLDLDLSCEGAASGFCQACVTVAQDGTTPFSAQFTSCSSGGVPPYTTIWLMPDGTLSLDASPTFLFSGPGTYGVCMQVSDATGCSSVACDTVFVGTDGTINPPGSLPCQAGFWVLQAYSDTSNGGGLVAPIPNELWAWNLSSGTDGIDQYSWDFGDGDGSAEPYPTHVYDGPGPWQLCLTVSSGSCTDTHCDTVSIDADGLLNGMVIEGHHAATEHRSNGFTLNVIASLPTGVPEWPTIAEFRLWPNPAQDELNISFNNRGSGTVPVSVIDATGRTVLVQQHSLALGINTLRLNTGRLSPGLYLVRVGSGALGVVHRFMKAQ